MADPPENGATGVWISVSLKEVRKFLGSISFLQQLPGTSVQKNANSVEPVHYGKGEVLLHEGTSQEGIYFIWKGEVTCFVLHHENADLLSSVPISTQHRPEEGGVALLERILDLETLEVDLYRGFTKEEYPSINYGPSYTYVFGGQLLGQALAAASKSVDHVLLVHSLHAYFLRTGDARLPIIYKVKRTRNGHTFAARRVSAIQKGKVIFTMDASFQRFQTGVEHQKPMPTVTCPDQLLSVEELHLSHPQMTLSKILEMDGAKDSSIPLDVKEVEPADVLSKEALPPWRNTWVKSKGKLTDEPALHWSAAAYASDWAFLQTAIRPHRKLPIRLLSLDHSMWFHKPFKADEWHLFVQSSPRASNGRGIVHGKFYNQNGELVLSVSQEGLLRTDKPDQIQAKSKL